MTGMPSTPRVEIEFSAGVWTDVSSSVRGSEIAVRYGRSSEFSPPQTATMSFVLDDLSGNFTPRNAASAYYPNVQPRKRVRYTLSAGTIPVFLGYITSWRPRFNGIVKTVEVEAVDRLDQLSRVYLRPALYYAIDDLSPLLWLPLDDDGVDRTFRDYVNTSTPAEIGTVTGSAPADVEWQVSDSYLVSDGLSGISIKSKDGETSGVLPLTSPTMSTISAATVLSFGFWATIPDTDDDAGFSVALGSDVLLTYSWLPAGAGGSTRLTSNVGGFGGTDAVRLGRLPKGTTHFFAGVFNGSDMRLYVDGVLVDTVSGTLGTPVTVTTVRLSVSYNNAAGFAGFLLDDVAWSASQVDALYQASAGYSGETTGTRLSRILGSWLGLPGADYSLDAGVGRCGAGAWNGKDALSALQEVAEIEGGGSSVYVNPAGLIRFLDRRNRATQTTPTFTFNAETDLLGDSFEPAFDALDLINEAVITRSDEIGSGSPQRHVDSTSQTNYGIFAESRNIPVYDDTAALLAAQDLVARHSAVDYRLERVVCDFNTATAAGLYTALASLVIGSRIRVNGITTTLGGVTMFPRSQFDVIAEGWSIDVSADGFVVSFDTSNADSPAIGLWNDSTYGKWQGNSLTLNATITSGATSLAVAHTSEPLSTTGGDYPLKIRIDDEVLTITSAPGSTASPQTVTVTRATDGTIAAAHTAGARINLHPNATWSL